jgi:KUP system potassium uptake protein
MFFTSTATKLFSGGWFPLLIAFVISLLMLTWRKGEELMDSVRLEVRERAEEFVARLRANPPIRVPGTAFALGRMSQGIPLALTQNLKHNHVMHERVFLVAVTMAEIPRVLDVERVTVIPVEEELSRVELCFGFMEQPDVPKGLELAVAQGKIARCDVAAATYFTGHETIIPSGRRPAMARWRERLFALMHRNAQRPGVYFRIPSRQIMEVGIEFEI